VKLRDLAGIFQVICGAICGACGAASVRLGHVFADIPPPPPRTTSTQERFLSFKTLSHFMKHRDTLS
jgi:hypothetical protein